MKSPLLHFLTLNLWPKMIKSIKQRKHLLIVFKTAKSFFLHPKCILAYKHISASKSQNQLKQNWRNEEILRWCKHDVTWESARVTSCLKWLVSTRICILRTQNHDVTLKPSKVTSCLETFNHELVIGFQPSI